MNKDDEEDPWAAFGEDDDDDEADNDNHNHTNNDDNKAPRSIALFLTQYFLKHNATLQLSQRHVGLCAANNDDESHNKNMWVEALETRKMQVSMVTSNQEEDDKHFDAIICLHQEVSPTTKTTIENRLIPGGILLLSSSCCSMFDNVDDYSTTWQPFSSANVSSSLDPAILAAFFSILIKRHCRLQTNHCRWLPSRRQQASQTTAANVYEYNLLQSATVSLSVEERTTSQMTEHSIQTAVQSIQENGYCLILGLLKKQQSTCLQYGQAVLNDLHEAATILKQTENVDLYHPLESLQNPKSYRELSMREDCRMDVRDGPHLQQMRAAAAADTTAPPSSSSSSSSWTVTATTDLSLAKEFFRGHPDLLQVVRRTTNPKDPNLYMGNFGRWNFSGSGPDGSFVDLRVGPIGGIVSLPGAADQALHADSPHLFEHLATLPAHYINAFTPGCQTEDDGVGQTAFIHGSHKLDVTAKFFANDGNETSANHTMTAGDVHSNQDLWRHLVRPRLTVGDVLLFDCRILHFGLANTSTNVERPLLYTNMTMHWFQDPKNWDDERPIFGR